MIWHNEWDSGIVFNHRRISQARVVRLSLSLRPASLCLRLSLPIFPHGPHRSAEIGHIKGAEPISPVTALPAESSGFAVLPAESKQLGLFLAFKINKKTGLPLLPCVAPGAYVPTSGFLGLGEERPCSDPQRVQPQCPGAHCAQREEGLWEPPLGGGDTEGDQAAFLKVWQHTGLSGD